MSKKIPKKSEFYSKNYKTRRVSDSDKFASALEDTLNNDLKNLCIQLKDTELYLLKKPNKLKKRILAQNFLWCTKDSTSYIEVSGHPNNEGPYEKIVEIQTMPYQNPPRDLIELLKEKGFQRIKIKK